MKLHHLIILALCGLTWTAFYFSGRPDSNAVPFEGQDPTHVIVDGDEMPGIGADKTNPDTALVYFNETDRKIHIKYLAPSKPQ